MSVFAYNTMTMVLGAAVLIALGVALYSFVFMLVRWKTPKRRHHIIRLILALVAVPFLAGIQYSVLFFVFLPALGRQQMAEINAARAENLAETSVLQVICRNCFTCWPPCSEAIHVTTHIHPKPLHPQN